MRSIKEKSFTLIEMMIVVVVFSIIIVGVLGVFISAVKAQKYSLVSQQLIDQSSYVMEYMSRFIRMAKKELLTPPSCLAARGLNYELTRSGAGLKFKSYKLECQEFYLESGRLYQSINGLVLPLTSDKFNVKNFKFEISGELEFDTNQPKVTIFLEMEEKSLINPAEIKIQTTISQRDIDAIESL